MGKNQKHAGDGGGSSGSDSSARPGLPPDIMQRRLDLFARRLQEYLDSQGEEQIHNLRTSVRRLESTHGALPKSARTARSKKYVMRAKSLFRRNSRLRDSDVIRSTLMRLGVPPDSEPVANLSRGKGPALFDILGDARKLAAARLPAMPPVDPHAVAARRKRKIWFLFDVVRRESQVMASDESKTKELHEMRKTVKKLRYLLEDEVMSAGRNGDGNDDAGAGTARNNAKNNRNASPDASMSRVLESVKKVQEAAGAIHDCDITIRYISDNYPRFENPSKTFNKIQKRRHALYLDLVGSRERPAPHAVP